MRRIDLCESKLLDLELESRIASDSNPASLSTKVKLVTEVRDTELEKLTKLSVGVPSDVAMREDEIASLKTDMVAAQKSIRLFEKLTDGPMSVSVVQTATPLHIDRHDQLFADGID